MISPPWFRQVTPDEMPSVRLAERTEFVRRSVMRASVAAALGRLATTGRVAQFVGAAPHESNPRD